MRPPTRVWWTGGLLGGGPGVPGSSVELIGGLLCLRLSDRNRDYGSTSYMAFRRRRATPASVASRRGWPPAHLHPPLQGEGRTAEGSPGWGGGGATDDGDAVYADALSPPPGPL